MNGSSTSNVRVDKKQWYLLVDTFPQKVAVNPFQKVVDPKDKEMFSFDKYLFCKNWEILTREVMDVSELYYLYTKFNELDKKNK